MNESSSPGAVVVWAAVVIAVVVWAAVVIAVVVWAAVVIAVDGKKKNIKKEHKTRGAEEQRLRLEIGCLVFDDTHVFDM